MGTTIKHITKSEVGTSAVQLSMSDDEIDTLYIKLPGHPEGKDAAGCVKKMIGLHELLPGYKLQMVNLDFDENKKLIGIEVIV